jgi:glycosyltransferase involved in cell wall biosynthesis
VRVLHLVHQFLPEYVGGVELYTQSLARHQVREQGHEVAVFYPSEQAPEVAPDESDFFVHEQADGVRIYGVPLGPRSRTRVFLSTFRSKQTSTALDRVLARERPELVHVQHLMGLPASATSQFQAAGIPVLITLHDYWFPCANAQLVTNYDNTVCAGPSWWLNCARCALARAGQPDAGWLAPFVAPVMGARSFRLRQVLGAADLIIAPTEFVRDIYADLGMPTEQARVVPHGIEVPGYIRERSVQERPRRPGQLHLVYVGSLAWQKGVHVLIDAVNRLPEAGVQLTIFGDLDKFPDYVGELQAMARHPGIHFAGRIAHEKLWPFLLQEADAAVLPTLWYEVSPLTIQEMFAARVPLVASRIGAIPEKINDGRDGLLFPPGDVDALHTLLLRLRNDAELLPQLRRQIQPTRLMEEHAAEVEALYREVT